MLLVNADPFLCAYFDAALSLSQDADGEPLVNLFNYQYDLSEAFIALSRKECKQFTSQYRVLLKRIKEMYGFNEQRAARFFWQARNNTIKPFYGHDGAQLHLACRKYPAIKLCPLNGIVYHELRTIQPT